MSAAQFFSQQSYDLDAYLPQDIDFEDLLLFQSPDCLTHSFDFEPMPSAHRNDLHPFEPMVADVNATEVLTTQESCLPNDKQIRINNYLSEQSMVIPHIPTPVKKTSARGKSPLSPTRTDRYDVIEKFMVFDATTGRERRPLLHEFIRILLESGDYSHLAEYADRRQEIFKLHKPKEIAELWKRVKGRNSDNSK